MIFELHLGMGDAGVPALSMDWWLDYQQQGEPLVVVLPLLRHSSFPHPDTGPPRTGLPRDVLVVVGVSRVQILLTSHMVRRLRYRRLNRWCYCHL